MSRWLATLAEHLGGLQDGFQPNELAYLALTQKVEHTIRDALAFSLYRELGDTRGFVCREWTRFDLAVASRGLPSLLLEAKAVYTFDICKPGAQHDYPAAIEADIAKAIACLRTYGERARQSEAFALLLATHPYGAPDNRYNDTVKYLSGVRSGVIRGVTVEDAHREVIRRMSNPPIAAHGVIEGGEAFGVKVGVAYWLLGPYRLLPPAAS